MSRTKITIIHDSFGRPSSLKKDWGFSAHVEFDGQRILFDTGNNAKTFSENCSHWDSTFGIWITPSFRTDMGTIRAD